MCVIMYYVYGYIITSQFNFHVSPPLRDICKPNACLSLVSVVCCQVEVSASVWSLFQRSPTEGSVSECDRESSIMRRPWPTRGCRAIKKNYETYYILQTASSRCHAHLRKHCSRLERLFATMRCKVHNRTLAFSSRTLSFSSAACRVTSAISVA